MAPAVAPMFRDVISSLQQLPLASDAEADRLFGEVQRTLEKALSENITATEWKAVVHKAKVPLHLGAALAAVLQHYSHSTDSVEYTAARNATTTFMWIFTSMSVLQAARAGKVDLFALQQQFQDSGVLQQLPVAVASAAAKLDALTAQIKSGVLDCTALTSPVSTPAAGEASKPSSSSSRRGNNQARSSGSSSGRRSASRPPSRSCGGPCCGASTEDGLDLLRAVQVNMWLANALDTLYCTCSHPAARGAMLPDAGACFVQHALAALQLVSACVQQVSSKGCSPAKGLMELAQSAAGVFESVAGLATSAAQAVPPTSPHSIREPLAAPAFQACILYSVVVESQVYALRQDPGAPAAAAAATAALERQHAAAAPCECHIRGEVAWQQACQLHAQQEDRQLDDWLQQLGLDRRAVLWAAAFTSNIRPDIRLAQTVHHYLGYLEWCDSSHLAGQQQLPDAGDVAQGVHPAAEQQQEAVESRGQRVVEGQPQQQQQPQQQGLSVSDYAVHLAPVAVALEHMATTPLREHSSLWCRCSWYLQHITEGLCKSYHQAAVQQQQAGVGEPGSALLPHWWVERVLQAWVDTVAHCSGGIRATDGAAAAAAAGSSCGAADSPGHGVAELHRHRISLVTCASAYVGLLKFLAFNSTADEAADTQGPAGQTDDDGIRMRVCNRQFWDGTAVTVLSTLESFVRAAAMVQEPSGSACSRGTCMGAQLSQALTEIGMLVPLWPSGGKASQQLFLLYASLVKVFRLERSCSAIDKWGVSFHMCLVSSLDAASKLVGASVAAANAVQQAQQQALLWGLMLLGHCCCDITDILRGAVASPDEAAASDPDSVAAAAAAAAAAAGPAAVEDAAAVDAQQAADAASEGADADDVVHVSPILAGLFQRCMQDCSRALLQDSSHAQPLSSAGYDTAEVQQLLEQAMSAWQSAQNASGSSAREALLGVAGLFERLGSVLTSLAVQEVCNNPSCVNMTGASEVGLVSGRSCMCGGCRVAHYCSRACQKGHWKQHKPVCKAVAAAARGGGATASSSGGGGGGAAASSSGGGGGGAAAAAAVAAN